MGKIGMTELILILSIALVIFGPSKLPAIGKSIGEAIGQFKSHANKLTEDVMTPADDVKKDEKKEN
ncbi:MAG: twin-arginine translocase TatA/TatE family subunit [Clostridia bacterium]|jgi:sec-independent protein translocase protein TatA|uniref:Sec-independent protein translocase protein TatA n=1 Tax=Proteiniclasticum aestuarii TaxID=2817862 RepID=A0A939KHZ7_9CLOT|nr:twin-arginine translocase TatA/TatE family subunit [Proteiniclasticum aestuarii]MBO1266084.1 twin-arginine translocase TatA/TatE family subunit [Proteiniclasticum aestuarii]NCC80074.1 twin-arginine translocase TatA/TatE family subunit [Clostridia bacterium]